MLNNPKVQHCEWKPPSPCGETIALWSYQRCIWRATRRAFSDVTSIAEFLLLIGSQRMLIHPSVNSIICIYLRLVFLNLVATVHQILVPIWSSKKLFVWINFAPNPYGLVKIFQFNLNWNLFPRLFGYLLVLTLGALLWFYLIQASRHVPEKNCFLLFILANLIPLRFQRQQLYSLWKRT